MRRPLLFLVFVVVSMVAKAQFTIYKNVIPDNSRSLPMVPQTIGPFSTYTPPETIVRGTTYNAIVFYESSTGYEATYKLPVVVNRGSVDKIIFNDNGMPQGQVSVIFTNNTRANYLMQIADFLKVNIKIEAI